MNYRNFQQETNRMVELMKYGINESTSQSSAPRVEYQIKAADGKTYGIVNEGTKFYIKVAPKKDTQIVNEDFDYIGGEMNKKLNEYKSYSAASKNLDIKIMQINEANRSKERVIVEASKKQQEADWQINETKEMRAAINRMNQISKNVAHILTEGSSVPSEHTLPEAPSKNPSQEKVNTPYVDTAVANGEKDFTKTETNYEKPNGTSYSETAKAELDKDKKFTPSGESEPYSSKALYTPNGSVTTQHPSGGKVVRADESNKRCVKLTEEQVLAWNSSCEDYIDTTNGTEIGDSTPYEDDVDCKTANQCTDVNESEEVDDLFAEDNVEDTDIAGFEEIDDENDEDVPFPEVEDDEIEVEFDGEGDDEELYENELHVFGKHPAYQKQVMTLPKNKEVAPNGAHAWDDKSVEGNEPYGKKVGSSAPFEKAVKMLTDSIMESLGF